MQQTQVKFRELMDLARRNGEAMAVGVGRRLDIGTTANIWRVIQRYHDEGFDDGEILYTQHSSLRSAEERLESYFGVELTDSVFFDDILGDKTGWVYIYVHADDSDDDDDDDYDEGLYYERSCYDQYDRRQGPCKAYCGYSEEEEEKEEEDYACESREASMQYSMANQSRQPSATEKIITAAAAGVTQGAVQACCTIM